MQIIGTDIIMIRGDDDSLLVAMKKKKTGDKVDFVDGDTVYLTVKNSINTDKKVLQKIVTEFDDGQALIIFEPSDTENLRPQEYVYDVQLTDANGIVTTIIDPESRFTIKGDVTRE